jgi:hypothetical protein
MKSTATTVDEYVKGLPEDRRKAISAIRMVILDNLPKGYQECMSYGMIGYVVPHCIYPKGHPCNPKLPMPFVNLGSQKNYMTLHLMCTYGDAKLGRWFREAWEKAGRKLDGGKRVELGKDLFTLGCIRFKHLEDVPLEVVGQLVARIPVSDYIARIESVFESRTAKGSKSKARAIKR